MSLEAGRVLGGRQQRLFESQGYDPTRAEWEKNGAPSLGTGAGRTEQTGTGDTNAQSSSDQSTNAQQQQEQQVQGVEMANAQSDGQAKPESAASEVKDFGDLKGILTGDAEFLGKQGPVSEWQPKSQSIGELFGDIPLPADVKDDGVEVKTAPDGSKAVKAPAKSRDGDPSITLQNPKSKPRHKIRERREEPPPPPPEGE